MKVERKEGNKDWKEIWGKEGKNELKKERRMDWRTEKGKKKLRIWEEEWDKEGRQEWR